jgi:hypothetical protein
VGNTPVGGTAVTVAICQAVSRFNIGEGEGPGRAPTPSGGTGTLSSVPPCGSTLRVEPLRGIALQAVSPTAFSSSCISHLDRRSLSAIVVRPSITEELCSQHDLAELRPDRSAVPSSVAREQSQWGASTLLINPEASPSDKAALASSGAPVYALILLAISTSSVHG